ncbi:MAG: serine/threonine protein kinase, partial [Candidatus Hydrogenedentes bacterium]|nr:serine/threonine protein kinase [Candidatus Hydrogenedentota bacterium]
MAPEPQDSSTENAPAVSATAVPLRYEIVRSLGAGGMGEVYLAKDTELPRQVAIKTIRKDLADQPEIRKRIERECRLHAQIGSHPNIVMLHDRVEHGGSICLVMEYVEGQTLQYVLEHGTEHGKPLEWSESIRIARQCLDALGRIHTHGIVHRDVKPANILLGPSDNGAYTAKLMDFGIARMTTETDGVTILTQEGTGGPGTPVYMAPEQIDSKKYGDVSPATDVYAMGIVLYQMLSGKPPFTGSLTEVFNGHLNQSPPPIALADGEAGMLDQVIGKALA